MLPAVLLIKISSWEGSSQTSCKFKLNFYNFKALLVTYWSFDRSKIDFFLYKTKSIVPFIICSGAQKSFRGGTYYFNVV